jgi:hypothetical protein
MWGIWCGFLKSGAAGSGIKVIDNMTRMNPNKNLSLMALLMLVLAGFMSLTACQKSQPPAEKPATGIHKTVEKTPVTLEVDVDRSTITVADRLEFAITVLAPAEYEAKLPDNLPESNEKETNFSLVEAKAPTVEITKDGRTRTSRIYILEPFLAGTYNISAMTVDFWKTGEKEKTTQAIDSPEMQITVTSLLPDTADGTGIKPHDIRPPAPLPRSVDYWLLAGGIIAGLLLAGLGIFLILRKRQRARLIAAEVVIPPHEAAFSALDALMAANLIEKGEIKVFYQEISGILRRYIEARFGLRAPEQTTEEFLDGLKTGAALDIRYQGLLKQFLTHCDLVKFAAFSPTEADIRNTIDSCRTFVQETRIMDAKT